MGLRRRWRVVLLSLVLCPGPGTAVAQSGGTAPSDSLPYLRTIDPYLIEGYPSFSFGVGYALYSPDYSGLQPVYDAAEERWRSGGESPAHFTVDFEASRILSWWLTVKATREFGATFEFGSESRDETDAGARYVAGTLTYQYQVPAAKWLRPYAGAGYGWYTFEVEHNYHFVRLNVRGSTSAFHLAGGVELLAASGTLRPSLSVHVTMPLAGEIRSPEVGGSAGAVRLARPMIGARLLFYL